MKKDLERIIEIPENVQVEVNGSEVIVKCEGKALKRDFNIRKVKISKEGNQIKISAKNATKREGTMMGTINAHIKNMINGMKEDYIYKMEVCNVHFPMNVKVEGDKLTVKSFLGEKKDRAANIIQNVKVDVKGTEITVSSYDIEAAGQTAANIEKATRLKGRDRRIFQDGIFITEKPKGLIWVK